MNYWTKLSIEYANQRSYLDDLFRVYPTIPDAIRDINHEVWSSVERAFELRDNETMILELLKLDLFPIKDSYVSYLRRDKGAITRNPETINRLASSLYSMGLSKMLERCSEPKETNRQIGPMFQNWLKRKDRHGKSESIGVPVLSGNDFLSYKGNCILDASDLGLKEFAKTYLNYQGDKGLDFIARFNQKYVVGEAKFLTDFGGHQNAQLKDAMDLLNQDDIDAIQVAILDGVIYIPTKKETVMSKVLRYEQLNIMSALVLKEFLYSI